MGSQPCAWPRLPAIYESNIYQQRLCKSRFCRLHYFVNMFVYLRRENMWTGAAAGDVDQKPGQHIHSRPHIRMRTGCRDHRNYATLSRLPPTTDPYIAGVCASCTCGKCYSDARKMDGVGPRCSKALNDALDMHRAG